jgi:histidinol-phosphatase
VTERVDLELALSLADEADRLTMTRFQAADLHVETKPDLTPVTEADRAVEQHLRSALHTELPNDGVLGEEFGGSMDHQRVWIVDPIDGTKNYVRGVPIWATLIALSIEGIVSVGVVSAPALGRRWWAAVGHGAWVKVAGSRDPQAIGVSGVRRIADASLSYSDAVGWPPGVLGGLLEHTWRQRAYGDFWSHVLVAEGAVDIAAEPRLAVHDMAALIPIVREAGGEMTGFRGGDPLVERSAVTTNGVLHKQVLSLLND